MKNIVLLYGSFILLLCFTISETKAQQIVSARATAEVIEALATMETAQLNFGRFSPETQGGIIIVTPEGMRTTQGTVILAAGTHNAASFYITGQYEATFSISLPLGAEILRNVTNEKTMSVSNWKSSPDQGIGVGKLVGGEMTVNIGATLTVGDMKANPVGIYAGTYSVTFAYN